MEHGEISLHLGLDGRRIHGGIEIHQAVPRVELELRLDSEELQDDKNITLIRPFAEKICSINFLCLENFTCLEIKSVHAIKSHVSNKNLENLKKK